MARGIEFLNPELSRTEPEAPNRYAVFSSATGAFSQHVTKVQAMLAYGRMSREMEQQTPRPQILEWVGGEWRAS